jgi:transposase
MKFLRSFPDSFEESHAILMNSVIYKMYVRHLMEFRYYDGNPRPQHFNGHKIFVADELVSEFLIIEQP